MYFLHVLADWFSNKILVMRYTVTTRRYPIFTIDNVEVMELALILVLRLVHNFKNRLRRLTAEALSISRKLIPWRFAHYDLERASLGGWWVWHVWTSWSLRAVCTLSLHPDWYVQFDGKVLLPDCANLRKDVYSINNRRNKRPIIVTVGNLYKAPEVLHSRDVCFVLDRL